MNKCKETFWSTKHNWGKWEEVSRGNVNTFGKTTGAYLTQERKCIDCGFIEIKTITD